MIKVTEDMKILGVTEEDTEDMTRLMPMISCGDS